MSTIFALSTAPGKAGVAVIRISGPESLTALHALGVQSPKPRYATLQTLVSPIDGGVIDKALVLYFKAPHSFTGEDTAELHLHGSRAVIQSVVRALSTVENVRMAEPGEFSKRAFAHGKMDLTSMEGLADLIDAETEAQQKQALRQMSGVLEALYESWRASLVEILAHTEAYIDFPDEDIPEDTDQKMQQEVRGLVDALQAHLEDNRGEIIREGVHVAIVGAPNVGKSSLMNVLAKKEVAIVSHIAGTTRDVIEVQLDVAGYPMTLCDTAGIREHADVIESEGIKRALKRAEQADMTLCVFAADTEIDDATKSLIKEHSLVVINKSDEVPEQNAPVIEGHKAIAISTKTGEGIETLLAEFESVLSERLAPTESPVLTRERHRVGIQECIAQLEAFLSTREEGHDIELSAETLRLAARALGQITGRIEVEEILDEIFSRFCIGK